MKAVSTFISIILVLCSLIFGAFLSYMWVMANFYLEPENTVDLVITEVNFSVRHADYFTLTVMNPSHSVAETNITGIYFTVEGEEEAYTVTKTSPELPLPLERATSKTIVCFKKWGEFAGKTISVHVSAENASGAVYSVKTKFVRLEVQTHFNASKSCKYFDVTVNNHLQSAIDLTLSNVTFDYEPVKNLSIGLPTIVQRGKPIEFRCFVDWQGHGEPLIQVETIEGYIAEARKKVQSIVILSLTNITFDETNPEKINITLFNSEESATAVDVTDIVLTYDNGTEYSIDGALSTPPFYPYYKLKKNKTITFSCIWPWRNYRNRNITIRAYTKQGFTSISETVKTPPPVIFKIMEVNFNLTDTEHFQVNVTNMPCSLQDINITRIELEENETSFQSQIISVGEERLFNCTFNWTKFAGENVDITVYTAEGLNLTKNITLPSAMLEIEKLVFEESSEGLPYVNVTILNTLFSLRNVTIAQIVFETENATYIIDGTLTSPKLAPDGYFLTKGANVTIVCPWDWSSQLNESVTIIVQTAEGIQVSKTVQVEHPTP